MENIEWMAEAGQAGSNVVNLGGVGQSRFLPAEMQVAEAFGLEMLPFLVP